MSIRSFSYYESRVNLEYHISAYPAYPVAPPMQG